MGGIFKKKKEREESRLDKKTKRKITWKENLQTQ